MERVHGTLVYLDGEWYLADYRARKRYGEFWQTWYLYGFRSNPNLPIEDSGKQVEAVLEPNPRDVDYWVIPRLGSRWILSMKEVS